MPLDPKYQGLPYIATDPQDSYESSDLPEADQHTSNDDQPISGDIERVSINQKASFDKFKGKTLNADDVDFTDRIYATRKTGYSIDRRHYEIMDEESRASETPIQRFQRLQAELRSLVEDVDAIKSSSASTGDDLVTSDQLSSMVQGLQQTVSKLHLDSILAPNSSQLEVFDPESVVEKKLLMEVQKLKAQKTPAGASSQRVFEVLSSAGAGKDQGSQFADLEKRLARIEAAVGPGHLKTSVLSGEVQGKPLSEAVQRLTAKSNLLDPANLDNVEKRLSALNHRLQELTTEKKEVLADTDTQKRVAELYQLVKKWDPLMDTVPDLLARLEALKVLHEQSMQFSGALNLLDESQRTTASKISSTQKTLESMEQRLAADLETIQKNTSALQAKMSACKK